MVWLLAFGLAGVLAQAAATSSGGVIAGRVLDASTNAPLSGVQVTLHEPPPREPGRGPFFSQPKTQVTDDHGRFAFTDLQPGRYHLNVRKTGFASSFDLTSQRSFDVNAGDRFEDIELRLQRGGAIAGRVIDRSGEPVVDASVMAFRKPPESATMSGRRDAPAAEAPPARPRAVPPAANGQGWVGSILGTLPDEPLPAGRRRMMPGGGGQTDDLGEFRIHSLSPGDYYVQAAPRGDFGGVQSGGGKASTLVATFYPGTAHADAAQPVVVHAGQTTTDVVVRMLSAPAFHANSRLTDHHVGDRYFLRPAGVVRGVRFFAIA